MTPILLWSFLAFVATCLGSAMLLARREWAKKHIWRILALASGILLGVAFVHILPEANELSPKLAGIGVLTSFLLIFMIEGFTMMHSCLEYAEDCHVHSVSWTALGALALHALIDGLAISIAFQKDAALGAAVASAILFHKFTDGLTLSGLLVGSEYSAKRCLLTVMALALATPLGALISFPFTLSLSDPFLGWLLGFIAGTFFYVGAADILPRLHKARDFYCLGAFALGLVLGGLRFHLP